MPKKTTIVVTLRNGNQVTWPGCKMSLRGDSKTLVIEYEGGGIGGVYNVDAIICAVEKEEKEESETEENDYWPQ